MRALRYLVLLGLIGLALFYTLTRPDPLTDADVAGLTGDATRGATVFDAAGCASCHMAPGATGDAARLVLSGGQRFETAFGTFVAPNISTHPELGIGDWTLAQFASAILRGVSPEGTHYYPALPYAAYAGMSLQEVADLHAFWATLPADATPSPPHEVGFPFSWRRLLGGWKLLFHPTGPVVADGLTPVEERGRHIAEALAHCAECHTPRNALGGLDTARWLGGVRDAAGREVAPNITPAALSWSEAEIVEYLTSGFTPDFDSVGGHMTHVVENMSRLPEADRAAVAAYLKRVPPVE